MKGQVVKAHSSHFVVDIDGKIVNCTARGLIKHNKNVIVCGDFVEVNGGVIEKILPRKNYFIRPNVSNVDTVVIVVSPEPKPDYYLIDKLCINAIKENCEIIFAINKTDVNSELYDFIKSEYRFCSDKFYRISTKENTGVEELKCAIKNKLCVLSGQSAVGKTSIVNSMFGLNLRTNELSEKILRGKHTTTYSELHDYDGVKLIDSPGFAVIDADVDLDVLPECYPEYFELSAQCKYRGCTHVNEPDCMVKVAVGLGKLSLTRYNRYVNIYQEQLNRRKSYD